MALSRAVDGSGVRAQREPLVKFPTPSEWTLSPDSAILSTVVAGFILCPLLGMGGYLVLAHQVRFAEDAGYSSMFSVSIFALFRRYLIPRANLSGFLSDRMGREKAGTLAASLVHHRPRGPHLRPR